MFAVVSNRISKNVLNGSAFGVCINCFYIVSE